VTKIVFLIFLFCLFLKSQQDVLRFNERILITTPYPGLFELEINLNPAIVIRNEQKVYNLGVHSKWRSGSNWEEVCLLQTK